MKLFVMPKPDCAREPGFDVIELCFEAPLRVARCFRWNRFSLKALFGGSAWSEASRLWATAGQWPKTKRLIEKELRGRDLEAYDHHLACPIFWRVRTWFYSTENSEEPLLDS